MAKLVSSSGAIVNVSDRDIPDLLSSGYRPLSAEEEANVAREEKYGGTLGAVEAGTAAFGRGLTLGGSDWLLTKSGLVDPETLAYLKELNPVSSTVGEIAGNIAPLLVSGGGSLAAKGAVGVAKKAATYAPARLATEAGLAAERALGGKVLGKVAGGALEGSIFGAGNVISEAALGDPNLTAESALTEIGLSGAFGGGIGGAFGLGSKGLEHVSGKIQAARDAWLKAAPGLEQRGVKAIGEISGVGEDTANSIYKGAKEFENVVDSPSARNAIEKERFEGAVGVEQNLDEAMEGALGKQEFDKLRGTPQAQEAANAERFNALQEVDRAREANLKEMYGEKGAEALKTKAIRDALENTSSGPGTATDDAVHQVGARIRAEIDRMKSDPFGYSPAHVNELEGLYDAYLRRTEPRKPSQLERFTSQGMKLESEAASKIPDAPWRTPSSKPIDVHVEIQPKGTVRRTASEHYLDLDNLKKSLDEKLSDVYSKDPMQKTLAEKAFQGVRGAIKETLENEQVWGKAAQIQKKVNKAVSEAFHARDNAMSEFGNRRLSKLGDYEAGEGFDPNKLRSLYRKTEERLADKQAIMDEFVQKTQALDDVVKELGGKGADLAPAAKALASPVDNELAQKYAAYLHNLDRAKSQFGNKRLEKIGEFEPGVSWDQKKFNTLATQQSDFRGVGPQQILNDYLSSAKEVIDALEKHPHLPSGPKVSVDDLANLHKKAVDAAAKAQRMEEFSALVKPSKMSFGSSAMPQNPDSLLSSGGWALAGAAAPWAAVPMGLAKGAWDLVHNAPLSIRLLAKAGTYGDKALQQVDKAAKSLVRGNEASGRTLRGPIGAQLGNWSVDAQVDRYNKRVAFVREHSQGGVDSLAKVSENLQEHMPTVAGVMQISAVRKLSYLEQAIPQTPQRGALGGKRTVSLAECQKFNKIYSSVSRPLQTLERASQGVASADELRAVRATSPALYSEFTNALIRHIAETGPEKLTSVQRKTLAKIFGKDVDGSLALGQAIAALPKEDRDSPDVAKPRGMNFQSKGSDRMLTPAQRAAQRSV